MNNVYGYCPVCGGLGMSRERRLHGDDRCESGHMYPSSSAVATPLLPVTPEHTAGTERAAIVRWLRACEDESCVFADDIASQFAAEIERGEHRREGGE